VDRERCTPSLLDGRDRLVRARFAGFVSQRDGRTVLCKTLGDGAANAPRCPGNESGFSIKRSFHFILLDQMFA
jgi:hypothetical protein